MDIYEYICKIHIDFGLYKNRGLHQKFWTEKFSWILEIDVIPHTRQKSNNSSILDLLENV